MSSPLFALFHLKHCHKFCYYVIPAAILYHISHLNYLKIILGPYDDHYIIIGPMPPSGHIVLPTFKIQIMFSQSGPKISCHWRASLFQVICDITFACLLYRIMKSVSTALFQSITRMYCTMSAISYQGKTHYWTRWDPTPLFKTAVWYTFFLYIPYTPTWSLTKTWTASLLNFSKLSVVKLKSQDSEFGNFYKTFQLKTESVPPLPWRWRWADVRVNVSRLTTLTK